MVPLGCVREMAPCWRVRNLVAGCGWMAEWRRCDRVDEHRGREAVWLQRVALRGEALCERLVVLVSVRAWAVEPLTRNVMMRVGRLTVVEPRSTIEDLGCVGGA